MEELKHECGIALIVLRKPPEYYDSRYGRGYGLNKLYLLMHKQHNRGQEGAGAVCINSTGCAGREFIFRERAEGNQAIAAVFAQIEAQRARSGEAEPFRGDIYMGHLRYSTTGRSGLSLVHPFLRRSSHKARNLALCGNFNMTNVDRMLEGMERDGLHPRSSADTFVILEQIGEAIDDLWHRQGKVDTAAVLRHIAPAWDGGYVICGATGAGETFTLRDPWGIRTAFVYADDEVVAIASERPVLQTTFNAPVGAIREIAPGEAVIASPRGLRFERILTPQCFSACSFERVYFSRGSDADIYRERKALGRGIAASLLEALDGQIGDTVFSYIPNTAEVAFLGMAEELDRHLDETKARALADGGLTPQRIGGILSQKVRIEKIAIKDIKLRTFISDSGSRNELSAYVYDITYGSVVPGRDTIAIIDDSIVRGTTLRQSILSMLARLSPRRIVILSSAPQVRYPDYYGIDMPRLEELVAFRAAVSLLLENGGAETLDEIYRKALAQRGLPPERIINHVREIYAPFSEEQISRRIAALLCPDGIGAEVTIIYQTLDGLHAAIPGHPGDWYFSGDYPTPGGVRLLNEAYIRFYESINITQQ